MAAENVTNMLNLSAFSADDPDVPNDGFNSTSSRIIKFIIVLTISTTVVLSNIINIVTLPKIQQMSLESRLFLLNLSSADLSVGLVVSLPCVVPALTGNWPYGEIWCQIAGLTHSTATLASVWFISSVSIGRYLAVVYPVKYKQNVNGTRCLVVALFIWVFSIGVYLTPILVAPGFLYYKFYVPYAMCGFYWEYKWLSPVTGTVYPYTSAVCIIYCTYKTIKALKQIGPVQCRTGAAAGQNGCNTTARRREERAIRLVAFTAFAYVALISPYCVVVNLTLFHPKSASSMSVWAEFVTMWMVNCNSFMNVIIYSSIYPSFRNNVKRLLQCLVTCSGAATRRNAGIEATGVQVTSTNESVIE